MKSKVACATDEILRPLATTVPTNELLARDLAEMSSLAGAGAGSSAGAGVGVGMGKHSVDSYIGKHS